MEKGTFVLSLDVEMAWGLIDTYGSGKPDTTPFMNVRYIIRRILEILDLYEIPATWAFVGHLFLGSCRAVSGIKHQDMPRALVPEFRRKDWYDPDPATDFEKDPAWYGIDLVEIVKKAKVKHEIACHSFSHVDFSDIGCTPEVADSEFKRSMELACGHEEDKLPVTFIFPKNRVAYLNLLKQAGFRIYRGEDPVWFENVIISENLKKIFRIIDTFLIITPTAVFPEVDENGLINLPGSMLLLRAEGLRRMIPASFRIRKAISGMECAIRKNGIFHLWFHPWNLHRNTEFMLKIFTRICEEVYIRKEQGRLQIMTMRNVLEFMDGLKKRGNR